jgi:hypothetical protein
VNGCLETKGVKLKIDQLALLITSISGSQKLISQVALDLQALALAKKHQIKEAIEQASELGEILEVLINRLKQLTCYSMDLYFEPDDD